MIKKIQNIYQFKITLDGTKPPIGRRIQVPESYSFWDLHVAIQDAMGWFDCHLHQFEIKNPKTGFIDRLSMVLNDDGCVEKMNIIDELKISISKYFSLSNNKALYEYNFGDSWAHKIILEKILPMETGVEYPRCIAGKRACPLEDCGGIWGYKDLLDIIKDPQNEEYGELMEWLGEDFDPEHFDLLSVKFSDPQKRLKMAY